MPSPPICSWGGRRAAACGTRRRFAINAYCGLAKQFTKGMHRGAKRNHALLLQPGQADSGDAPKVRRRGMALVDKVTTIGLEAVVDPVPGVADVHVPNDVALR